MQGIQYSVTTRYRVQTARSAADVDRLAARLDVMKRRLERAERSSGALSLSLRSLVAPVVITGLAAISRGFASIQKRAEDARIGIAAVFHTLNPKAGFTRSLERANDLYERFKKASILSPATSNQFMQVFQPASAMLSGAGLNNEQITKGISRLVPAAMSFGDGDFAQTGRDVRELLTGTAGAQTKIFNPIRQQMFDAMKAKDVKSFNTAAKANPRKVWDALQKVLRGMDDVNKAYATSFSGLTSSTIEMATLFVEKAGAPLFAKLKEHLSGVVDWLTKNQDRVNDLADTIGGHLTRAFELAAAGAKLLLDNMQALLIVGSALAAKKFGGLMMGAAVGPGGMAGRAGMGVAALASGQAYRNVGARALTAGRGALSAGGRAIASGAVRAASLPLNIAGELMFGRAIDRGLGVAKGANAIGATGGQRMAHGAGVIASGLASGGVGMLSKVGMLLGGIVKVAAPVAVVLGLVVGTFIALKNKANEATIFFHNSVGELFIALDTVAVQFGSGGGFVSGMKKFAEWLGTGVVGVMGIAVKAVERVVTAFSYLVAALKGIAYGIGGIMKLYNKEGLLGLARSGAVSKAMSDGMKAAFDERRRSEIAAFKLREKKAKERKAKQDAQDNKKRGKAKVTVNIHQEIKTDADPDRIAFRTGEAVRKAAEHFPAGVSGITGVSGG